MTKKILYYIYITISLVFVISSTTYLVKIFSSYKKINNKSLFLLNNEKKYLIIEYKEDIYQTKDSNGNIVTESRRNIPIIKSIENQKQADKIVNYLTKKSNERWKDIKKSADEYTKLNNNQKVGVNYILGNVAQSEYYSSFIFRLNGHMGGLDCSDIKAYTFNNKTGKVLKLSDITSNNKKLKKYLSDEIINYISKQEYVDKLDKNWKKKIGDTIAKTGNWYINEDGLNIIIPKYSIGPGIVDIIEYRFDYKYINSFLLKKYKKM